MQMRPVYTVRRALHVKSKTVQEVNMKAPVTRLAAVAATGRRGYSLSEHYTPSSGFSSIASAGERNLHTTRPARSYANCAESVSSHRKGFPFANA